MKTIGLIGGMSWESSLVYYRKLNLAAREALGGLHSAPIILHSLDFAPIEKMQREDDWQGATRVLRSAAKGLEAAGADCFLLCTNTMHRIAEPVAESVSIPLLHIVDATAEALLMDGVGKVGLLGTSYTMEAPFFKGRLADGYAIEVVTPEGEDRLDIHRIIFEELCRGEVRPESRNRYLEVIAKMADAGAEAVVLGCTEIGLLIGAEDSPVPLYDTADLHVAKAVRWALDAP